jgi:dihydroorotate dehydrogenase
MYKAIIRPILFLFPPEFVHKLIVFKIRIAFKIPFIASIVRHLFQVNDERLKRNVAGLTFDNPVGLAAGFDKNAGFFNEFSAFGFGHIEIGTLTPVAQPGNPKPRSFRLPKDKALINRMGFNNIGVDNALKNLQKNKHKCIIGGNIGKNTLTPNEFAVNDYLTVFTKLYTQVDYFVVNVSCPNITDLHKLQDQDSLSAILQAIVDHRSKQSIYKPVFLKISPDLNDHQVDETIDIVQKLGIDGFVVANTTITRYHLRTSEECVKSIGKGGLSGLPVQQRSTELIRYISLKTDRKLPIIGVGGIFTAEDAIEKLNAGASLVQVYTGFIYEGPMIVKRINKAILAKL